MAGAVITIKTDDREVRGLLNKVQRRLSDMTPVMKVIGEIVRTSVVRNFEKGGRPKKWAPLSKTTLARRKKGGGILRVQGFAGGLMGSITARAYPDKVVIGTNKIYAAVHQFGAKKGQFGRVPVARKIGSAGRSGATLYSRGWLMSVPWGDIPARPFLMVQDEDWGEIKKTLGRFILRGGK